jgi:DNA-binding HxlR family transcriptional regulator
LIVRDLAAGQRRFVELGRVLPGISTEQLRSRLNRMVADGLLTRTRYREVPPRVDYELTERARADACPRGTGSLGICVDVEFAS